MNSQRSSDHFSTILTYILGPPDHQCYLRPSVLQLDYHLKTSQRHSFDVLPRAPWSTPLPQTVTATNSLPSQNLTVSQVWHAFLGRLIITVTSNSHCYKLTALSKLHSFTGLTRIPGPTLPYLKAWSCNGSDMYSWILILTATSKHYSATGFQTHLFLHGICLLPQSHRFGVHFWAP